MASKHQQEDPWAGFVDVLSNILMVVIFLVVILGMAIFALSQQITKVAVDNAVKVERERARSEPQQAPPPAEVAAKIPETPPTREPDRATAGAPVTEASPPLPSAAAEAGAAGVYDAIHAPRVRQEDDLAGNTNLTVRSLKTTSKDIDIAPEEIEKNPAAPVEVKQSHAFLSLKFAQGSFKIDEKSAGEINDYLKGRNDLASGHLEIRAFAQSTVGSVSEARRIAYYRAMQTRTELIKTGFQPSKIDVKLRESVAPEEMDVVRLFVKP
ncbi:hypothetical protein [Methylorubrum populi]